VSVKRESLAFVKMALVTAERKAEFGVSMPTLYRWLASGRLAAHRRPVGRTRTFVDRRQVRELLDPRNSSRKRK
jgi:predicted site-specific integrase-resolvase